MQSKIKTIDLTLLVVPIIFLSISVAVIYSLVMGTNLDGYGLKQGVFVLVGLVIMIAISLLDYRYFRGTAWVFYIISIILLVFVELFGKSVNGAMNWIDLKVFQLQPSEVAKIFVIITLATYFGKRIGKLRWLDIIASLCIVLVPLVLILREPDLGTAIVICFIFFIMLLSSKPTKSQLAIIFGCVALAVTVCALAYLNIAPLGKLFKDYQRERISVFLDPDRDPYGRGYNVKQAQITIGSGGITGRGLGKGPQSQLQFLPEPHTDFIFAGIAESFGFAGSLLIIVLYSYFLIHLYNIASIARDNFGMLSAIGIAAMFGFQVVISIGMNLGLLPVTGIPLPLLSYGGTSLFISMFSIGFAQSIFIRHKKIAF